MQMKNGLLIDTNLLLVMIIGGIDEGRHISQSKRLGAFCIEDYYKLWEIVKDYENIWITPYIATEASNLIDLDGDVGIRAFELARELFGQFSQASTLISDDCHDDLFLKFGLTDNSIINLSKNFYVLTNDQRMFIPLFTASPERVIPYVPHKILNA
ncbi:hypothetical protein ACFSQE_16925 [Vogesella fluminis]|uniref:PIN domain-containing protein n=1 Tax=Vogesella fluminis TaxID=1069161 RepID=A0ABQ3HCP9_9NEIS|nr:hypothetical protein [Vogesella fluminis]GHD82312.1 hypothetical protein GCM10011419_29660 [Vogesella fluminis]